MRFLIGEIPVMCHIRQKRDREIFKISKKTDKERKNIKKKEGINEDDYIKIHICLKNKDINAQVTIFEYR